MNNNYLFLLFVLFFSTNSFAQFTSVPDDKFEQALIDLNIDTDRTLNDQVKTSDISGIKTLDVHAKQIYNLKGIEDFTSLEELNCSSNKLASIDISSNVLLVDLRCNHNDLSELNISNNKQLKLLTCHANKLESLNLVENKELEFLNCGNNRIGYYGSLNLEENLKLKGLVCNSLLMHELDVSKNTSLDYLDCRRNYLEALDISNNDSLETFYCDNNQITELNLSNNLKLVSLYCFTNQLKTLNLDANIGLHVVWCGSNQLKSLDVSMLKSLKRLECTANNLNTLNVKNGSNSEIYEFNATLNPSLICIKVDNAEKANAGSPPYQNWKKDETTSYSEDCIQNTVVNDSKFEELLISLGIDTDGEINGNIETNNISEITSLDLSSSGITGITDITGIEAFFNLETLIVSGQELTSLDVSNNTALTYLDCSNNLLTTLDLSNNLSLITIDVSGNPLTSLTLPTYLSSGNISGKLKAQNSSQITNFSEATLLYLDISNTDLASIDVSEFESLDSLNASGSKIDFLDVSANINLGYLNTTKTPLTCIQVNQNQLNNIPTGWEKEETASYAIDCQSASAVEYELFANSIRLFPNPVSGNLSIESKLNLLKVEIYSIAGKKVQIVISDFHTIPTQHLPNGIYILKIHSEKAVTTKKFTRKN